MRITIIAGLFLITGLTKGLAQKGNVKHDSTTLHQLVLVLNEDQATRLNMSLNLAATSDVLNNSDQFSTKGRNQIYAFLDSLAGVIIRQQMLWHPAPKPAEAKQDSVIPKSKAP